MLLRRGSICLFENYPLAKAEAPYALHGHGDELAEHLGAAEGACRPSDEPGSEEVVPQVQAHEQRHAAPEVAGSAERDVAVHEEVERGGHPDGERVGQRGQHSQRLQQREHAELDEGLGQGDAVVAEDLAQRLACPAFGLLLAV